MALCIVCLDNVKTRDIRAHQHYCAECNDVVGPAGCEHSARPTPERDAELALADYSQKSACFVIDLDGRTRFLVDDPARLKQLGMTVI